MRSRPRSGAQLATRPLLFALCTNPPGPLSRVAALWVDLLLKERRKIRLGFASAKKQRRITSRSFEKLLEGASGSFGMVTRAGQLGVSRRVPRSPHQSLFACRRIVVPITFWRYRYNLCSLRYLRSQNTATSNSITGLCDSHGFNVCGLTLSCSLRLSFGAF